ncbi:MAG: ABC transporter ATP-binding protein [Lachnospiraceae bacterium]|nr:ABC transporter ATP-binding protein [Lachnospiraceae bacterium]
MEAIVEVRGLTKQYGEHTAISDLSFTMEKGKVYGFLGPNGAGKSTTMNIMTGYLAPDAGSVSVLGYDITRDALEAKKHIGYLPEIPPLYPDMTIREYLTHVARLKKIPKERQRDMLARILKMTHTGSFADRLIRHLSKGYRQRVGMAQALIGFPDILILDEPTVGLDPQQIIEVREMIDSLRSDHLVILSSHILSEVSEVCDELLIISRGKKVAQGPIAALEEAYRIQKEITVTIAKDGRPGQRERAKKVLTDAGFEVSGVREEGRTLEEIFLRLTKESAPVPDGAQTEDAV